MLHPSFLVYIVLTVLQDFDFPKTVWSSLHWSYLRGVTFCTISSTRICVLWNTIRASPRYSFISFHLLPSQCKYAIIHHRGIRVLIKSFGSRYQQTPKEHLPNIISIIQGSRNKLNDPKAGPVYFYDNKITSTYYLSRVDDRVVLIVIYLERHVHREAATTEFMTNMVISLRGTSVIGDLSRMDY